MSQQTAIQTFAIEQEFELSNDNYQSNFEELLARMAVGGLLWQMVFGLLAVLSLLVVAIMNAINNIVGIGGFLMLAVLFFYCAFLPYRHAKTEIGIYYELIEDGEELSELSDYPLSGFFHYMAIAEWAILILMLVISWISLIFLAIAFDNNHQSTFLLFLFLFFVSIAVISFVIFYANAKKDYYLSE